MKAGPKPKGTTWEQRITGLVEKQENGCWKWIGSVMKVTHPDLPYGVLKIGQKRWLAHRFSWFVFKGEIPPEMKVCHKCDYSMCVNPDHLFLGTTADNNADCVRKGRHARGEKHSKAKLTDDIVLAIRRQFRPYKRGKSARFLAKRYNLSQSIVLDVANGVRWKHVQPEAMNRTTNL